MASCTCEAKLKAYWIAHEQQNSKNRFLFERRSLDVRRQQCGLLGEPWRTRTPDLPIRSGLLYPAELTARTWQIHV
jgi:hypothetical protein